MTKTYLILLAQWRNCLSSVVCAEHPTKVTSAQLAGNSEKMQRG